MTSKTMMLAMAAVLCMSGPAISETLLTAEEIEMLAREDAQNALDELALTTDQEEAFTLSPEDLSAALATLSQLGAEKSGAGSLARTSLDYLDSLDLPAEVVTHQVDLDRDGEMEHMIVDPRDCNDLGCLFGVIDHVPGDRSNFTVTYNYGSDPKPTADGALITASGVYWHWNGVHLKPWGNALDGAQVRKSNVSDMRLILGVHDWRSDITMLDVSALEIDLIGDQRNELVLLLSGVKYLEGKDSPYYIFSADGKLLDTSLSEGRPSIFPLSDRDGFVIVQTTNGAQQLRLVQ